MSRRLTVWLPFAALVTLAASVIAWPWGPRPTTTLKATPAGTQRLCVAGVARGACLEAARVEAWLRAGTLDVRRVRETPSGAQGASVVTLAAPGSERVIEAKWRPQSSASDWNDPAAELIAHRVQELVLSPRDHVVPPTAARCVSVATHGWWLGGEIEPEPGTGCVLGVLSYWLTGSTTLRDARRDGLFPTPDDRYGVWSADPILYDADRFARSRRYRRAIASLNLVAYLIGHGDAHTGQFVLYRDPLHLFVVDNSVAFGVRRNEEIDSRQNLADLWVPAIERASARRVRSLRRADVEALATVAAWIRVDGSLHRTAPGPVVGDPDARLRREGDRVQLGLTRAEVDALWARVRRLQRALEDGTVGTFDGAANDGTVRDVHAADRRDPRRQSRARPRVDAPRRL